MIKIRYDYKLGDELPYAQAMEALNKGESFSTNCLEFFSADNPSAVVIKQDGGYIVVRTLLENTGEHTNKHIRKEHNLHKMLVAGLFNWKYN